MQALGAPLAFIGKRAAQAVLVMLTIAVIAFAVKGALGDPLREIVGEAIPEAERVELRRQLGLDAPWPVQLARYVGHAAQGDLGQSYIYKQPTLEVVLAKFPASFELVLAASLIVLLISLPAGIYCAVKPRSLGARLILGLSVLGISVPVFLTGIILISIFSVWLGLLPAFGRGETVRIGFSETGLLTLDGLKHLLLPAVTLSSIMLPLFIRLVRGAMLDQLGTDYVRTARAKGASRLRVWLRHALRNALLPLVALGGLQIGNMLAFTLLTETVFQWPGMGFLFLEAVTRADVPLITTYLVTVGFLFVVTNTLADVVSLFLDPAHQPRGAAMIGEGPRTALASVRDFAVDRPGSMVAALLLGTIALAAFAAPLITPQNPFDLASFDVLDADLPPRWLDGSDPRFLLGTDSQGRDLLSAILYGTRISSTVGVLAVAIQAAIASRSALSPAMSGGGWMASLRGSPTCSSRSPP